MNSNYDFAIALGLNNWQIEAITYNEMPELGPRWNVKVRFHKVYTTDEVFGKLRELKADCATQELVLDHATVSDNQYNSKPIYANLDILEPNSKSAYLS